MEGFSGGFTAFFEHGLLLVHDSETRAAHEDWDATTDLVHFDTDSLYIVVRPMVEGPVTVTAFDSDWEEMDAVTDMIQVFDGEFPSKFGLTVFHDPNDSVVMKVRGNRGNQRLRVWVDQPEWAVNVVVAIG